MRSMLVVLGVCASFVVMVTASQAEAPANPPSKFNVTPKEKAACMQDAVRLCIQAYPDEDALISCMRTNRANLSPNCLTVFDAGLKRRHM